MAAGVTTLEVSPSQFQLSSLSHPHPLHLPTPKPSTMWTPSHTTAVPGIPAGQQQAWACSNTTRMKRQPLGGSWGAQPAGTWHHWPPLTPTPANTTGQTPQLQPSLPPSPQPTLPRQTVQVFNKKVQKMYTDTNPQPRRSHGGCSRQSTLEAGVGQRRQRRRQLAFHAGNTGAISPPTSGDSGSWPGDCPRGLLREEGRAVHQPNLDSPHMPTPPGRGCRKDLLPPPLWLLQSAAKARYWHWGGSPK